MLYVGPLIGIVCFYVYRHRRRDRHHLFLQAQAHEEGMTIPDSLHPLIHSSQCIGCGACAKACPEKNVLGIVRGKVELLNPGNCIGHGACADACPVDAISLVLGTAERGVDIPTLSPDFETSVPGIYIAGELGGMGLIRNAIEQGRQAVAAIANSIGSCNQNNILDLVIVGAGPAGIAASLGASERNLNYVTLDQEQNLGGTVAHFPRGKLVMTQTATLPLVGEVKMRETSKEALLEFWHEILCQNPVNIQYSSQVRRIETDEDGFKVHTKTQTYSCRRVLLAIGRRGSPRKLNIPGEELSKVVYRMVDPLQYQGEAVLVVGGGDSALEAAATIAEETDAEVTLAYRGDGFSRAKAKNRHRIKNLDQSGRISVMLNTVPVLITDEIVNLQGPDEQVSLLNDAVIVCAGGELPTGFLKNVGILMETKYGTV